MMTVSPAGTLPKGIGVMMAVFLLVMALMASNAAAARPKIDLTLRPESSEMTTIDWDPNQPPAWAIRPEDREGAKISTGASMTSTAGSNLTLLNADPPTIDENLCTDRWRNAVLYKNFDASQCPPKFNLVFSPNGILSTCEKWNSSDKGLECATFCQTRTQFEWAEERPYPNSDCHFPAECHITERDSTTVGWRTSISSKVGKALKIGISGGYSQNVGHSVSHGYKIALEPGQCGYWTFIAVKKVTCGVLSSSEPGLRSYSDEEGAAHTYCDTFSGPVIKHQHWARNLPSHCATELWEINNRQGKLIPDGITIFVFTDCATRSPRPMAEQDEAYQKPGVALDHLTVRNLHDSWIWNTCYFWNMNQKSPVTGQPIKSLYLRGTGFSDNQLGGPKAEGLIKSINDCAGGHFESVEFEWYDNGYPNDNMKERGTVFLLQGDVPLGMNGACVGDVIMRAGGNTIDMCGPGS